MYLYKYMYIITWTYSVCVHMQSSKHVRMYSVCEYMYWIEQTRHKQLYYTRSYIHANLMFLPHTHTYSTYPHLQFSWTQVEVKTAFKTFFNKL